MELLKHVVHNINKGTRFLTKLLEIAWFGFFEIISSRINKKSSRRVPLTETFLHLLHNHNLHAISNPVSFQLVHSSLANPSPYKFHPHHIAIKETLSTLPSSSPYHFDQTSSLIARTQPRSLVVPFQIPSSQTPIQTHPCNYFFTHQP